jgi:hypothetical protein
MIAREALKHLRPAAHWHARIERVQRDLDDAAIKPRRVVEHLKKTLAWLQEMVL